MKKSELCESLYHLLKDQPNALAALSNFTAFINQNVDNLNWVGFYFFDGMRLTVGPFQGKVACSEISLDRGVCGEAATSKQTIVVPNVHEHPNHIACDNASMSEVVIPLMLNGKLIGVLDIDSPIKNRFDKELVNELESFATILLETIDFTKL